MPALEWTCDSEIMPGNTTGTLAFGERVGKICFASVLHRYSYNIKINIC